MAEDRDGSTLQVLLMVGAGVVGMKGVLGAKGILGMLGLLGTLGVPEIPWVLFTEPLWHIGSHPLRMARAQPWVQKETKSRS